jgi:hypothetical protein
MLASLRSSGRIAVFLRRPGELSVPPSWRRQYVSNSACTPGLRSPRRVLMYVPGSDEKKIKKVYFYFFLFYFFFAVIKNGTVN